MDNSVAGLATDDEAFVSQATEFYTTVWDDSEAFDPRTPAFARLQTTLEGAFGEPVAADFSGVLAAAQTARGDDAAIGADSGAGPPDPPSRKRTRERLRGGQYRATVSRTHSRTVGGRSGSRTRLRSHCPTERSDGTRRVCAGTSR